MKYQFTILGILALAVASASGQMVASHNSSATLPQASTPAPAGSLQVTGKPVARVNDAVLTDRDLLREMFALFPYASQHNGFPKGQEAEIRRGAMQMIIFEELVYQEALRRKMTIAPERIARDEKKFRAQFATPSEFDAFLKREMDGSQARFRQQVKRSLLIEAMLKNEVEIKSAVSAAEARAYYEKNPKQYQRGETFTFQTISIVPPANANQETLQAARKRADAALQQAKASKSYEQFGLLAEKLSEDDFRVNMGDHKTVVIENLPPEVVKAARAMKAGEVSGLLPLGTAYTIIRLNAHTVAGRQKFTEVQKELTSKLQKEKTEKLRAALGKRLHQNAKVQEL